MLYKNLKSIYKRFKKNDYWNVLGVENFFHIRSTENHNSVISFLDNRINDVNAIQFVVTKRGFNFIHDLLEVNHFESSLLLEPEVLTICSIKKEDLTDTEKLYIKSIGGNITKDNNILAYTYKSGYTKRFSNLDEIETIIEHLFFMEAILEQDFDKVMANISNGLINYAYFNMDSQNFYLSSEEYFELRNEYHYKPCFDALANQYSNITPVDDEGYLIMYHLPISIGKKFENPFLLIFFYPNAKKIYFDYSVSNVFNAKNDIFIPIDSAISKIGLPMDLYITNRYLYALVSKTLRALNINPIFNLDILDVNENIPLNSILYNISIVLDQYVTDYHYNNKKETINILNIIVDKLNQINFDELIEKNFDYDYNEDDDFNSNIEEIN